MLSERFNYMEKTMKFYYENSKILLKISSYKGKKVQITMH